jgi:DNA-binding MarR family transcriptional regulator
LTEPGINQLVSYRIHRLAGALSRGAAATYRQGFQVSLLEWRTVALLGDAAPLTLKALARQSGLDKSLVSRTVTALAARGLVLRSAGRTDAREVTLRLSASGLRLHAGLMRAAAERDAALRGALTAAERDALDGILDKLHAEARRLAETPAAPVSA